jgi:hypothetical protein
MSLLVCKINFNKNLVDLQLITEFINFTILTNNSKKCDIIYCTVSFTAKDDAAI